ncbi:DUF6477 family protein [Pseudodonghicola xiamenensis]|uniref:Uncharacterized protein n=1 Tax=Pseudodonghicola xiamenensis TaxID=337702 RepID=A0A8J3H4X9_9RHOB|nr:DUF6477 family protein [Pseudodonghicola xiamenensis]GHG80833.1 hypothetical protein GCM10010961_04340 [Pseudodonghicola xiamenensis]
MIDLQSLLATRRRPRLLVRAARLGARDYRREVHLPRVLGYGHLPAPAPALLRLLEIEQDHDDRRRAQDAGYSLSRHLDTLIALVGEAALLESQRRQDDEDNRVDIT